MGLHVTSRRHGTHMMNHGGCCYVTVTANSVWQHPPPYLTPYPALLTLDIEKAHCTNISVYDVCFIRYNLRLLSPFTNSWIFIYENHISISHLLPRLASRISFHLVLCMHPCFEQLRIKEISTKVRKHRQLLHQVTDHFAFSCKYNYDNTNVETNYLFYFFPFLYIMCYLFFCNEQYKLIVYFAFIVHN